MKIISRREAKAAGLTRYFTGQPCKHGHIAQRDVINFTCVECTLGWKRCNAERVLQYAKDWYWENRDQSLKTKKKYFKTEQGRAAMKRTREKNKEKRNTYTRNWREINPDKQKAARKSWYDRNGLKRHHYKYQNDLNYKLSSQLRCRVKQAIKNGQKAGSAVRDLGCSIEEFRIYLERQFSVEMSWSNWGTVWELDHIKPLVSFDLTDRDQFQQAAHFTNMQPLLKTDHWKKSVRDRTLITKAA